MPPSREHGSRGLRPPTIQSNANLPTILPFELLPEHLDRAPMRHQQIMPHNPRLSRRIAHRTLTPIARMSRRKHARAIPQDRTTPRLIKGNPVPALAAKGLENDAGVVCKVRDELFLVKEAAVPVVEGGREIPVVQGDHGRDACCVQVVGELEVVVQPLLVDRVAAAAEGDDAGPARALESAELASSLGHSATPQEKP